MISIYPIEKAILTQSISDAFKKAFTYQEISQVKKKIVDTASVNILTRQG
jgi:hypothetical protein